MRTAIVIYQSTPMFGSSKLPNGAILGMFKQTKLVTKLNQALKHDNRSWTVYLDDSEADIEILSQKADALICVPGLQKQFDIRDYPKEKVFYFDSLSYHELSLENVLKFLESIDSY